MHAFSVDTSGNVYDPDAPKYADPGPGERKAAAAFRHMLRADPPAQPTDNRWKQAQHLKGVIYVAIRAVRNLAAGATYEVVRRKQKHKARATFGPGNTFAKALPGPQMHGKDEDYTPFEDEDHPLARMVKRPNPNETFGELAAKLVLQNRLTGVGPLWTVPNDKHKPVELWSLKTPLLYPIYQQSRQYPNGAWRVMPYYAGAGVFPAGMGSGGAVIPGEEVRRWMEPHPYIDWDGYSPLTAGDKQLDCLESIDEARKTSMDEGVVLGTYVLVPGASQDVLDRIVKEMAQKPSGSRGHKAFRAFAFGQPDSKGTIQTDTQRPVDMDYSEGWEQMVKFCLALFGVPASVAGLQAAGSYSEHYAARQQFHDDQADYLESLATFFTKALAWPWCSFPDEYLVRVTPRPINDHELAEKKHSRQCQNNTITLDESRAKDDLPAWPDPEIGQLPVSIALEVIGQKVAPQPQPGAVGPDGQPVPGMPPGADAGAGAGGEQMPQDAAGLQDAITSEALGTLGVPDDPAAGAGGPPVQKAWTGARAPWDEGKHSRNHGKFAPKGGGASGGVSAGAGRAQHTGAPDQRWGSGYLDKLKRNAEAAKPGMARPFSGPTGPTGIQGSGPPPLPGAAPKPPPLPPPKSPAEHQQRVKASAPKVARMAGQIPGGADVLASASRWAVAAADKHADRVAAHLGISREQAHSLVRSTIEQLCNAANSINRTGRAQKTYRGKDGKKLRISVKQDRPGKGATPTGGGPPRPANPMGAGSRPPLPGGMKAMDGMSGLEDSAGGYLVPGRVSVPTRARRRKRRALKGLVRKAIEGLE
jgi:hypothetical protein